MAKMGEGLQKTPPFPPAVQSISATLWGKNLEWSQDWRNGGHLLVCEVSSTHVPIFQMRKVRFEEVGLTP